MTDDGQSCKYCLERIPLGAQKCRYCGSFQNWPSRVRASHSILALMLAAVSVISLSIPMVSDALRADDSDITLSHINRTDVSIPIIASNKGTRPASVGPLAVLEIEVGEPGSETVRQHGLFASLVQSSRADLFLPENTSRQLIYFVIPEQPIEKTFSDLAADMKTLDWIRKCRVRVTYIDFGGREHSEWLTFYDAHQPNPLYRAKNGDQDALRLIEPMGCLIKIPEPIRRKYGIAMKPSANR